MTGFPDLPPIWLLVFLALNWAIAAAIPGNSGNPFLQTLGWSLVGLGLLLIVWAALWFWRKRTTIEPHHAPGALIVEGPFRVSRNPIYLGMLVILAGSVVGRGQPLALLLLPFFYGVLTRRFIEPEEAGLRAAFGAQAEHYFRATRRWL